MRTPTFCAKWRTNSGMSPGRSRSGGTSSGDDGEAIVEILAKAPVGDGARQIAVGGGDDAHVDLALLIAAERPHAPLLQHAQQARLQIERQVADLVEEQRAAVRLFEEAVARLRRRR